MLLCSLFISPIEQSIFIIFFKYEATTQRKSVLQIGRFTHLSGTDFHRAQQSAWVRAEVRLMCSGIEVA